MTSRFLLTCALLGLGAGLAPAQTGGPPAPAQKAPVLKTYSVPAGNAEALAKTLREIFANSNVRIVAAGRNQLLVWANPDAQFQVAAGVQEILPPVSIEVIPLSTLKAVRAFETLQAMFGGKGPFLEADPERNALIVRGTKDEIADIKAALRALGEGSAEPTGSLRIFTLKRGHASVLAEAVAEALPKMRANTVRVVLSFQTEKPPKPKSGKPSKENTPARPAPGDGKPVTLTAVGNRLVAVSDDPQALALVKELINLFTADNVGDGDFEVMRLRYARASAVAAVLEEVFNGRKAEPRLDRVRIVADPVTNSLLVKAAPIDVLMVRQLLRNTLDTDAALEPLATVRSYVFPLRHLPAAEAAKVLREVFRDEKSLSLGVDTRTNSLVVRCAPALEADINALLSKLDVKEK
jgi:type II secretory pathway component GspD/PulD (secretin)